MLDWRTFSSCASCLMEVAAVSAFASLAVAFEAAVALLASVAADASAVPVVVFAAVPKAFAFVPLLAFAV